MEQCRQGKSVKWIRNLGKRIGSEGWAWGSQFRTRRLSADCSSCSRGESGSPRAGRGTDWKLFSRAFRRGSNSPFRMKFNQAGNEISDAHDMINEIPTYPCYIPAKPQPRERAGRIQRGRLDHVELDS
ncbi:hypothetical protein Tco_0851165 [Tanacetum coccineum]